MGKMLIVEFIPENDARVKQMMSGREKVFADYNEENFRIAFEQHYIIEARVPLPESGRVLFLMTSKNL
jgi:hypothetical protein